MLYQLAWTRMLAQVLGSNATTSALVLVAVFAGVALGNRLAVLVPRHALRRVYCLAELMVAAFGCASPWAIPRLQYAGASLIPTWMALGGFVAVCTYMLVPCVLMGATIPMLSNLAGGMLSTFSRCYSVSTAGSAIGAILCGFCLLPAGGFYVVTQVGAILSITSAGLAWKGGAASSRLVQARGGSLPERVAQGSLSALIAVAFTTAHLVMSWESLALRLASVVIGSTLFVCSAILGGYLLGLGLARFAATRLLVMARDPHTALAIALLAASLWGYACRVAWVGLASDVVARYTAENALTASVLAGIGMVACGTVYGVPFLVLIDGFLHCGSPQRMATVLSMNTLACAVSGVLGALVAIPRWGSDTYWLSGLLGSLACAAWLAGRASGPRATMLLIANLLVGIVLVGSPKLDMARYVQSICARYGVHSAPDVRIMFSAEAPTGFVCVAKYGDLGLLMNDGLIEAQINLKRPSNGGLSESLLPCLAVLLRGGASKACVVGLGGGTTANVLGRIGVADVTVLELEPTVGEAAAVLWSGSGEQWNEHGARVVYGDARSLLQVDDSKYDIIVCQASHPWTVGASDLFTEEYFRLVGRRLVGNGVCGHWVSLYGIDLTALRSVIRAFFNVFAYGFVLVDRAGESLLLLGSSVPIFMPGEDWGHVCDRADLMQGELKTHGIYSWIDLAALLGFGRGLALEFAGDVESNRDHLMLPEVRWTWNARPSEEVERVLSSLECASMQDIDVCYDRELSRNAVNEIKALLVREGRIAESLAVDRLSEARSRK